MIVELAFLEPKLIGGEFDDDIDKTTTDSADRLHVIGPHSTVGFTLVADTADPAGEDREDGEDVGLWQYSINFGAWFNQAVPPPVGDRSDLSSTIPEFVSVFDVFIPGVPEPSTWALLAAGFAGLAVACRLRPRRSGGVRPDSKISGPASREGAC